MRRLWYAVLSLMLFVSCQKSVSVKEFLSDYEKYALKSNSLEYNVLYKHKSFSFDDTLDIYANCRLIRHSEDTFFGGSFWIEKDSLAWYYDLKHIYTINHKTKKIVKFFPEKGQDWAVKGSAIHHVLDSYFFKPNLISKICTYNSKVQSLLKDSVINDGVLKILEVKALESEDGFSNRQGLFVFNSAKALKYVDYKVKFQNEWQYNEWHFLDEIRGRVTDEDLKSSLDSLKGVYSLESYKEPAPEILKLLSVGSKAPEFSGFCFQTQDSLSLKDFKGKYVVLDFWYRVCYPCIQAIASLTKVREKYDEDKLVMLGLNPFDNKRTTSDKLKSFIKINKMNYPTVFVSKEVVEKYKVTGYPSFYVINPKGEIIYSEEGYREGLDQELEKLLDQYLK